MIGEPALSLPVGRVGGSSDDVGRRVGLDIAVEILSPRVFQLGQERGIDAAENQPTANRREASRVGVKNDPLSSIGRRNAVWLMTLWAGRDNRALPR